MGGTSRISREAYVRFCERLGVRFPGSTRRPQLSSWGSNHANPRLVDLSSLTPSGGGLRADPVQKHDPGERISRKSENAVSTNPGWRAQIGIRNSQPR